MKGTLQMIKNSILALTAAVLVTGAVLPAFAAPAPVESTEVDTSYLTDEVANDYTLLRLQEKGIKASAVEEWNGLVRATLAPVGL
jgi:ABC-type oligopeptide transport system substrate-binding subunit